MNTEKIQLIGIVRVKSIHKKWKKSIKKYGEVWYLFGDGTNKYPFISSSPDWLDVTRTDGYSGFMLPNEIQLLEVVYDDKSSKLNIFFLE